MGAKDAAKPQLHMSRQMVLFYITWDLKQKANSMVSRIKIAARLTAGVLQAYCRRTAGFLQHLATSIPFIPIPITACY